MTSRLLPTFYHCRNVVPAVSSRRPYSQPPHHKRTPHYSSFRKGITALRSQLVEEHKLKRKMMNEDFNSQDAQEVRMEREREGKALEQNEKEIQRMAERREKKAAKALLKEEQKHIHGVEVREAVSANLTDIRKQRVLEMIEHSKGFVTMENLEEKIEEALAKEVNYNFALSISGKKIEKQN